MSTVKSIYLMDPEKVNYDLIEAVVTWIANGDHDYPKKGSILVSTEISCELLIKCCST